MTTLIGDCLALLPTLEAGSVQACVTSPPYFGLRDYGVEGQHGSEDTPEAFVQNLVAVFREVRRVLKDDGTLWVNLGDSYNAGAAHGIKAKDLTGIPWMVAFALRADGWYLRQEIIWSKPNPMPESVTDRCTKSHEHIFLLSKSPRYYYDADAIREPASPATHARMAQNVAGQAGSARANGGSDRPMKAGGRLPTPSGWDTGPGDHRGRAGRYPNDGTTPKSGIATAGVKNNDDFAAAISGAVLVDRNKRSVWTVPTQGMSEAHFATFPEALIEPCILAGSRPGDLVLDPYMGAGTTAIVCDRLGRRWIGCELNPDYAAIGARRLANTTGGLPL